MKNINELVEIFMNTNPENTIIYDRIDDTILVMTPEMLDKNEIELEDGVISLTEIIDNRERYLLLNFSYEDIELFICEDFLKCNFFKYNKEVVELTKLINFDKRKVNKSFYKKLEKYEFKNDFYVFQKARVKDILEDYLYRFNCINVEIDKKTLKKTFLYIKELYNQKSWEIFPNLNLIRVKTQEYGTYYVSVLGNNHDCYGFNIYKEENLEGFAYIVDEDIDNELAMGLQNNFTIYYDRMEDIDEDELQMIKESGVDFSNEEMAGYFVCFNKYRYPTTNISNFLLQEYIVVLQLFEAGIYKMKEKKMSFDFENGESLEIIQQSDYKIRTRKYSVDDIKITPSVVEPFVFTNLENKRNLDIEMKLIAVDAKIFEDHMADPVWTFMLLIYDSNNGMILDALTAIEETGISPIFSLQNQLEGFFDEYGYPQSIKVDDVLTALIVSPLDEECEIINDNLSEGFYDALEGLRAHLERDEDTAEA